MITLGINAAFVDSAAVLVVDGVPVAAAEEERFTRIRHAKRALPFSTWELPFHAVAWCLGEAGVTLADVDHVAYSFDPRRFAQGRDDLPAARDSDAWDPLFLASVLAAPAQLADGAPPVLRQQLLPAARRLRWQWQYVDRLLCHQAAACLSAPFESCAVMTLDDRGERGSARYGTWRDHRYRSLGEVALPHSFGALQRRAARHVGFVDDTGDVSLPSLAAFGQPRWAQALADRVHVRSGGQFVIEDIDLAALAGPPREPGAPLTQAHHDLAASLQQMLERKVLEIAVWLREASGEHALAFSGSAAQNIVLNSRLRDEGPFDAIWVPPAAADAGSALGAALWVDARARSGASEADGGGRIALAPRRWQMSPGGLGPQWADDAIEALLRRVGLAFERFDDDQALVARTVALLTDEHTVGWFQGRMAWGSRALGARSILASPMPPGMRNRVNALKGRRDDRPLAPAVTAEAFADWFAPGHANGGSSPYRAFAHHVLPGQIARVPSICRQDGGACAQTVHAETHPRLHALLRAFAHRTGVPVLAAAALAAAGRPIACSPQHALEFFCTSALQALVLGACLLVKPGVGEP